MNQVQSWNEWRARREAKLREPHGVLALTGTHWLDEAPAPIVDGEPVLWSAAADGKTVQVTARAEHGLVLRGRPIDGTVTLQTDSAEHPDTVSAPEYGILLVPIEREGRAALRVYDPNAATLKAFDGIDAFDFDPKFAVPAHFEPYDGTRVEKVLNADGVVRGLGLDGTVTFELEDGKHEFAAALVHGSGLWIVFADPTTASSTPSFRFLTIQPPETDGSVMLDFNRAYLPPCAFADHYVCPIPPRGNRLEVPIRAGEYAVRTT